MSKLFYRCNRLQTIYREGAFDSSGIASHKDMLTGCYALVGAQGGNGWLHAEDQRTLLSFGETGLLTDPADDNRVLYYGHIYEVDGTGNREVQVSASGVPDTSRTLVETKSAFGLARYQSPSAYPWHGSSFLPDIVKLAFLPDVAALDTVNLRGFLKVDYEIAEVAGLCYVPNCTTLEEALESNGGLEVLDLRRFDSSCLVSIKNMFFSNSHIRTILADADWDIPVALHNKSVFVN